MAMLSLGLQKMTTMIDKRDLVSLLHSDMLLLAVLDLFSKESHELKSLERRSMYLMDDIFSAIKKDFGVCIWCKSFCIAKLRLQIAITVGNYEYIRLKNPLAL